MIELVTEHAPGDTVWVVDAHGAFRAVLVERRGGDLAEIWTVRYSIGSEPGFQDIEARVDASNIHTTPEPAVMACMRRSEMWLHYARTLMEEAQRPVASEPAEPESNILIVRIHEPEEAKQ